MWTIKSAELEGNDIRVTLTDGASDEVLTWGRNRGENNTALKARVKAAIGEVLIVRNPSKPPKVSIPVEDLA